MAVVANLFQHLNPEMELTLALIRVKGSGFKGLGVKGSGFKGLGVKGSGLRVQGLRV